MSKVGSRVRVWLWVGALGYFLAVVGWGAVGLRGTDQFWFASDLAMVSQGKGLVSNYILPNLWSSARWSPEVLPPAIHNIPVIYPATAIDAVFGDEYLSWVVLNALFAIGSAVLVYFITQSFASPTAATAAAVLFLVAPQTVWYTLNPFSEQASIFYSLLLVWGTLLLLRRPNLGAALMAAATILLAASRPNMLLIIPCGLLLCAALARKQLLSWRVAGSFLILSCGGGLLMRALLPQYPDRGLRAKLAVHADSTRLAWRLSFTDPDYAISLQFGALVDKAVDGLVRALVPARGLEIIMVGVVLVVLGFGLFAAQRDIKANLVRFWAVAFFGIYLLSCAVFLANYRFAAALTPLAIVLAVPGAQRLMAPTRPRALVAVTVAVGAAVAASSLFVVSVYRDGARQEMTGVEAARQMLETRPPGSVLYLAQASDGPALSARIGSIQLGYAAAPRPVLVAFSWMDQFCVPTDVVERWNVTTILASGEASMDQVRDSLCSPADLGDMSAARSEDGNFTIVSPGKP